MNGKLIVIEGLDGSGKATQAEILSKSLENSMLVSFPDYESPSSALVKMYLEGKFGTNADSVNPYAVSSFFACDRFASFKSKWGNDYADGKTIIADRYTTSNAIYQCSKLPESEWNSFINWLFEYEYNYLGIPSPDIVIYLKVDTEISQRLMSERYKNDESKKDIHEKNSTYLEHSGKVALYCAEKLGWHIIDCSPNGNMRSIEDISNEILKLISIN